MGLLYRQLHQAGKLRINLPNLLVFGLLIHLVGLFFFASLPGAAAAVVLRDAALPLILIYTPATAMLGLVLQDVVNRQLTEATLKASEERYRVIFRNTPVGNIVIDETGVIKAFNPAAEAMFGCGEADVSDKPLAMLLPGYQSLLTAPRPLVTEAGNGGSSDTGIQLEAVRCDSTRFPVQLNTSAVTLGDKVAHILYVTDLSRLHTMEKLLQRSQKMEIIGQLSGGIAHDFNNSLAAISGWVHLATEDLEPDHPSGEALRVASSSTQTPPL
jgi:PAS domain S-box-containing protein